MKKIIILLVLLPSFLSAQNLVDFVNPFIGTGGHGHTFPGATAPFGFCQLSPDTRIDGSWDGCGGYHYSDSIIYGFSHTHLSGTGVSDYGDILLMPVTRKMRLDNYDYKSKFLHISEKASPGYYRVFLEQTRVGVELTASPHCGFHRYTFKPEDETFVVLDLAHRDELLDSRMHMVDNHTIRGYRFSKAWATNQKVFFEIKFEQEIERIMYEPTELGSKTIAIPLQKSPRALIKLKKGKTIPVTPEPYQIVRVKVGISGVDMDGAQNNLKKEIPHFDFEKTKKTVQEAWNTELSKIRVRNLDTPIKKNIYDKKVSSLPAYQKPKDDKKVIFYSALYHSMIAPNIYSDVDGRYRGRDDKIHSTNGEFDYYTVFSLWDTYRALHPLLTIIDKKRTNDFIRTFIKQYEQGGRLPVWELSSNETNCMIGYHVVSVIWDAYNKGIRDYDAEKAFEAMKSIATEDSEALKSYMKYGYIRAEDDHESVSKTLEYAYNDWCIAQMAKALGKEKDYKIFKKRSNNWINVYDPTTGFMRARKNSTLMEPFSPYLVDNNYTEANSWQYSFYVPHDVKNMIRLYGGNDEFEKKLDDLFSAKTETEGRMQSDITGLIGQYAHGNEPSHHIAYLYHLMGKKEKGNKIIKKIMDDFYTNAPDGYIGNEDCGQMSAWYVLNAAGIYSVCPGEKEFVLHNGALLKNVKFKGSQYSTSNQKSTSVINGLTIATEKDLIGFDLIRKDTADFLKKLNEIRIKDENFVSNPFIVSGKRTFEQLQQIDFRTNAKDDRVFYRFDGEGDFKLKTLGEKPMIGKSRKLEFYAKNDANAKSPMLTATFVKLPSDKKVFLSSNYSKTYHAGGPMGLVDGIHGKENWRAGDWQGYQGQDFEAVIALDDVKEISDVTATFLQDQRAWIFYPTKVKFAFSTDQVNWVESANYYQSNVVRDEENVTIKNISMPEGGGAATIEAKYIRVTATNYGNLPDWHPGRGNPAYIFIDEIDIK